jgi:hypothetical protein
MKIANGVGTVDVDVVIGAHTDGWICERHPEREFPHDDCNGPGMPLSLRITALVSQREAAYRQAVTEAGA